MKRAAIAIAGLVILLAAIVLVRTINFTPKEDQTAEPSSLQVDRDRVAQHLSEAIKFKTVSKQKPSRPNPEAFEGFIKWFENAYPEVHGATTRELINYTILLKWEGTDPDAQPILLTGHYDVVPVIPGTESMWKQPPYAGNIVDGYVWGRGALDDKSAVIAIMESATLLVKQGFQPKQTVYLSFGHDEEVSGKDGADMVAAHLKEQGIQLEWSLDEGSFVIEGMMPGIEKPVASINVAEKGYATLRLIATGAGGHSSMPPSRTAVGELAEAITKLQTAPFRGGVDGIVGDMLNQLGRHMSFTQRMAIANQWLFGSTVASTIGNTPAGNAMMRTTIAPTMLSGSIKENVLPIRATATINFRIHPRDSVDGVVEHVRKAIQNDNIEIKVLGGNEASNIADIQSRSYTAIEKTTRQLFPDAVIAPGLTVAATDSRYYSKVSDNAYRFNPMIVGPSDLATFHGTNEKISIDNLEKATVFYAQLLLNINDQ